jgi:diguanylate cyclase (GGDEF)-like protein/PAS domain S-box-containing protein
MTSITSRTFRPFAPRARLTIVAIVLTLALVSTGSAALSIWSIAHSRNQATVLEIAARQRTLAERYVEEVLLVRSGNVADPHHTGVLLAASAHVLLDGGVAPAVEGDDDDATIGPTRDAEVRAELMQEQRLVADLTASGTAYLDGRSVASVPLTAHEHILKTTPLERLRVLAALTSNVSLNAARTIAAKANGNVDDSIYLQLGLGVGGLIVSVLLAWALVATTRQQSAHFRSLVTSSTDLVLVISDNGCRYASGSVGRLVGRSPSELLGQGYKEFVHPDDAQALSFAQEQGTAQSLAFRMRNASGEWRHLDAHLTDLRGDRHLRGVVVNARDVTDRVRLERELTLQAQRDTFGAQLVEAFEMADEEHAAYDVVRRGMEEISAEVPMELLLSDSSRAHLEQVAVNPSAGAPSCPVESPFSCVAVRRGNPVVFESSDALNACPKLRDRPGGACSAVCVPISFMGRSLGVLHATGPDGEPPSEEQTERLATLAGQAGARIGTVRAFARTQLQASTDGLTGLINRRTLETQLRTMMRQRTPFALAIADLDHFKNLNDTHGHEAGDRSLRTFSQATLQVLREVDLVARWGGEEFVIVMPGADGAQAVDVLERVRANLAHVVRDGQVPFTASFGVTDSTKAETLQELVQLADLALYASKNGGRDRITVADELSLTLVDGAGRADGPSRHTSLLPYAVDDEPHVGGLEVI